MEKELCKNYLLKKVLTPDFHQRFERLTKTLQDNTHPISIALRQLDRMSMNNIGPNLALNSATSNMTTNYTDALKNASMNTIMTNVDLQDEIASEDKIRRAVGNYLKTTGASQKLIEDFQNNIGDQNLREIANAANNQHLVKALGIPGSDCLNALLTKPPGGQGSAAGSGERPTPSGSKSIKLGTPHVSVPCDPRYLALIHANIPTATSQTDEDFVENVERYINAVCPDRQRDPRLKQTRRNTLENAERFMEMRGKRTTSIDHYGRRGGSYPEVVYTDNELRKLKKKNFRIPRTS